jgi:response regulator RpfG family c-di-GMP phosphodiesterase
MTEPVAKRIRVLLVDDEPMVRLLCRRMLEPAGYDIFEAEGVTEALANGLTPPSCSTPHSTGTWSSSPHSGPCSPSPSPGVS